MANDNREIEDFEYDDENELDEEQLDELKGIKEPGKKEEYIKKAKASIGGKILKAGLKKMVGMDGTPSEDDSKTIQKRVTGIARSGDRQTAAGLAHMTGSNMPSSRKKKMREEVEMEEETLAASTLKPGSKSVSDDKSKLGLLSSIMSAAGGMSKDDLNHFAATMSQFGPNKDYGVGDNSKKNAATIAMKGKVNVKEDIEEMFAGHDLSEEFKESVETLFEAAVSARLTLETARLEEEYELMLQEELAQFQNEVNSRLDSYLDYVVEQWMSDNEVAIESTLRNELTEEFMEGLKNLFAEHFINIPQEKVDVIEALAEKVEALEGKLDEVILENTELKGVLVESHAHEIFEGLSSDLALTQQEKFAALAEGIEFDGNLETYEKKLRIIKENYFRIGGNCPC
jgi:hypothetical protein